MTFATKLFIAVLFFTASCSRPSSPQTGRIDEPKTNDAAADHTVAGAPKAVASKVEARVVPLTEDQLKRLLQSRLDGGMGNSFQQFANMFLVSSRINLGPGVALVTPSKEIAKTELQSPFPNFYQPTLREFLDAIALQTSSAWKYDPTGKYFESKVDHEAPVEDLTFFELTTTKRERPFAISLAKGWKQEDKGNWLMLIPPNFPVGMDIYEMGTYSTDEAKSEKELLHKVQTEVASEWARRVRPDTRTEDQKPVKVGAYDALFFEGMTPSQLGKDIHWRQWVFMVDNKCYFVVSTILPELDKTIFPDVEKMLASFQVKH